MIAKALKIAGEALVSHANRVRCLAARTSPGLMAPFSPGLLVPCVHGPFAGRVSGVWQTGMQGGDGVRGGHAGVRGERAR